MPELTEIERIHALRAEVIAFDQQQQAARNVAADAVVAEAVAFCEATWFDDMIAAATAAQASLIYHPRLASLFGNIVETCGLLPRFTEQARSDAMAQIVANETQPETP
jgi:hypothetical protein